jgi:hypothetical protein
MVHTDADFVCRRCRVDLLTGEKVAVAAAVQPGAASRLEKILNNAAPRFLSRASNLLDKVRKQALRLVPKRFTQPRTAASDSAEQVAELTYCLDCGGVMKPATVRYFPGKIVYPFLALAVVLIGLGLKWHGLFATAGLSVAGFFVFRSLKLELWKCGDCSNEVKREKSKKAGAAGPKVTAK